MYHTVFNQSSAQLLSLSKVPLNLVHRSVPKYVANMYLNKLTESRIKISDKLVKINLSKLIAKIFYFVFVLLFFCDS